MPKQTLKRRYFIFLAVIAVFGFRFGMRPVSLSAETAGAPQILLSADFSETAGKIRKVNGTNLGPRLSNNRYNGHQELFNAAHFGIVRLHDAPADNSGFRLVDMQHVFGNLNSDPADPANYYFTATDDYIKTILDGGATVMYRLGASIEHSAPNTYFAKEPEDYEKTGEIFAGIVRHYNRGWGNGFHYNIEYWEIWNEPNIGQAMWDKDFNAYCRFYAAMAKRLKREFPEIKVGGPAISEYAADLLSQFIDYCRQEEAPLDFCSWHAYTDSLDDITASPAKVRRLLDERGFTGTELHLDEWHYFNCSWSEVQGPDGDLEFRNAYNNGDTGLNGIDAAAFDACALIRWQDTPLDSSCYYCTSMATDDTWGLIDDLRFPFKTYYAFRAFGELAAFTPNRIRCGEAPRNFAILGGIGDDGAKRLMVASFKEKAAALKICVSGVPRSGTVSVESLEAGKERKPAVSDLAYTDGVIDLGPITGSTVKTIRFPTVSQAAR